LKGIKKWFGDVSVYFKLELNTLGSLGTPAHKEKFKGLILGKREECTSKMFCGYTVI